MRTSLADKAYNGDVQTSTEHIVKLYYMSGACSLATHIVLEWVGAAYELQRLSHDELKQDAFLRVNPAGAVPTLDIDGWILTQNAAILNYLAETHPDAQLLGDGTTANRAEVNRWFGMANSDLHPAFKPLFGATGYLDNDAAIEATKARAKQTIRTLLTRADAQLRDNDWIAGSRSIADPYWYVMTRWAKMLAIDTADLDGITRFAQRMDADAAVRKALQDEDTA